ncbi:MAG: hypothetical protein HYU35_01405 [Parcubacteria group bacterium]|nr:hypothetical protein [Parcubacteria group bacterium]
MRQEPEQQSVFAWEKDLGQILLRRWDAAMYIFFLLLFALFLFSGFLFYWLVLREDRQAVPSETAPAVTINRQELSTIIDGLEAKAELLEQRRNEKPDITDPF